ncbi:hypothetical protein PXD04_10115 [Methanosphaera sp. ISO3-F5]|uniref:hypothetical protein n=1 Tax=Methanosphaera sp. ISO3-F5 TaxID=1452353 RepID=UPI002B259469|nr:hypothetical protein [Methanosphaera sp. ISO3-F5]WQH64044.1 hypothetical protein PXD04_10115 [Methanosphaera sp. ISO3-F5]
MSNTHYNNRVWMISELIKLVAVEDIGAISFVANQLRKHYNTTDIEKMSKADNLMIYDCYCKKCGGDSL